ncbi:MAG: DUF3822 family protein [Bacteroidia bacterium]|nr:DUF3822 family protein [Bacteroidia bacterium]
MPTAATAPEFRSKALETKPQQALQLHVVLLADRLEYLALGAEPGSVVLYGAVPFAGGASQAQALHEALATPSLKLPFKQTVLTLGLPFWTLVPEKYLAGSHNLSPIKFIETLYGLDPEAYEARQTELPGQDTLLLYGYPHALKPLLGAELAQAQVRHLVQPLLATSRLLHQRSAAPVSLHVQLLGAEAYYVLQRGKELIFCNRFEAAHPEDALFYALSVVQQFGLPKDKVMVMLTGRSPYRQALEAQLAKAFGDKYLRVRTFYAKHPELNAAGLQLDELAFVTEGLLLPEKVGAK